MHERVPVNPVSIFNKRQDVMILRLVVGICAGILSVLSPAHSAYIDFAPGLGDTFEARVSGSALGGRSIFDFNEGGTAFADDVDFLGTAGVAGRGTMGNSTFIANGGILWDFFVRAEAGFGTANAFAQSGVFDGGVGGVQLLFRVVPESEPVGTPFNVTFQANLSGTLTAEGSFSGQDSAEASWSMFADNTFNGSTPIFQDTVTIVAGSTEQSTTFSDSYSRTFQVLAGDTFELFSNVAVDAFGNDNSAFAQMDGTFRVFLEPVVVPIPAAIWLFGSGLIGLIGVARRKAT